MTRRRTDDGRMSWSFHPLRRHPAAGGGLLLFALGAAGASVAYVGDPVLGVPLAAVFLLSLSRWFLPTTYCLSDDGVAVSTPMGRRTRPWSAFHGFTPGRNGILLTRLRRPTLLDRWRGLFLYVDDPGLRERLTAELGRRLGT